MSKFKHIEERDLTHNRNGIPFELSLPDKMELERIHQLKRIADKLGELKR